LARAEQFGDLEVWQKARGLVREVYRLTSDGRFSADGTLRNQIRQAALSVMANIAEGFERGGNREFLQFLAVAKGSCGETRSHLVAAQDLKYVSEDAFTEVRERALEVSRMISGLMGHLRRSALRGSKYR
jgi:four helix bundle protein